MSDPNMKTNKTEYPKSPLIEICKKHYIFFLLVLVLVFAFIIRFKGIWFGYPLPTHPDEPTLVEKALKMIATKDLNPHFFNYPTLNIYLQALVYRISIFVIQLFSDMSATEIPKIWFYLIGRTFNVFLAVITIYVTYEIGKRLVSPIMGLVSACFIGASFLHINNSFLITVDSPVALWASLSCLMAVLIYTNGKKTLYYLLGGVFVGLAISSKYTAFISVTPILIAHFIKSFEHRDWIDKNIIAGLLVIPVAFLVTTPFAIVDYKTFWSALKYEAHHYKSGHPGSESTNATSFQLYFNFLLTYGYGLFPLLFSGFGIIWLFKKNPWGAMILLSIPVLLFLMVGRYKVFFSRNIVAVIPFLALFSAYFIVSAYQWLAEKLANRTNKKWIIHAISILTLGVIVGSNCPGIQLAFERIHYISLPDTRWLSIQWIKENIPAGSHIGREHYTPPIEDYAEKYTVSPLGYFAVYRKTDQVKEQDYMIVSSGDYKRFINSPDKHPQESKSYNTFFKENELVYTLLPDDINSRGPQISVYKINKE